MFKQKRKIEIKKYNIRQKEERNQQGKQISDKMLPIEKEYKKILEQEEKRQEDRRKEGFQYLIPIASMGRIWIKMDSCFYFGKFNIFIEADRNLIVFCYREYREEIHPVAPAG